jgi:uncharacterized protein
MSRINALFRLQEIDSQIDNQNTIISRAEAQIADSSAVTEAKTHLEAADTALKTTRTKQRDNEYESEKAKKHAEDLEKKLYGNLIKGAKEIENAQREIENFKKRHKELDDEGIELMLSVEAAEDELKKARAKLTQVETEKKESDAKQHELKATAETELQKLNGLRTQALKAIMPPDVPVYEKLRNQKQGVAVAEILNAKICGKCRVEIPSSLRNNAKSGMQIVNCQNCGRILYWRMG